jgi:DNA replication protein DnaD
MDKVLSGWHAKGLSTLEECRAANSVSKAAAEKPTPTRPKAKSKPEKPRYGDFDVNDAFAKALERSYGED